LILSDPGVPVFPWAGLWEERIQNETLSHLHLPFEKLFPIKGLALQTLPKTKNRLPVSVSS